MEAQERKTASEPKRSTAEDEKEEDRVQGHSGWDAQSCLLLLHAMSTSPANCITSDPSVPLYTNFPSSNNPLKLINLDQHQKSTRHEQVNSTIPRSSLVNWDAVAGKLQAALASSLPAVNSTPLLPDHQLPHEVPWITPQISPEKCEACFKELCALFPSMKEEVGGAKDVLLNQIRHISKGVIRKRMLEITAELSKMPADIQSHLNPSIVPQKRSGSALPQQTSPTCKQSQNAVNSFGSSSVLSISSPLKPPPLPGTPSTHTLHNRVLASKTASVSKVHFSPLSKKQSDTTLSHSGTSLEHHPKSTIVPSSTASDYAVSIADTDFDTASDSGRQFRSEDEEHRRWRRNSHLLWQKMVDHRAGNSFLRLPKPSSSFMDVVKVPLSLDTIKARIREGKIKSDPELHRDLLLMFANSVMYYPEGGTTHENALDMFEFANTEMRRLIFISNKRKNSG